MDIPTYILNFEPVVGFLGRWPSFHDANVTDSQLGADSIDLRLHTWLMTDEIDSKGYFVLRNHALVSFRFNGPHDVQMDAFRSGNVLFELNLSRNSSPGLFRAELDSVMDVSGAFSARFGEVVSVTPCTAEGVAALNVRDFLCVKHARES
jgi:hypothetical protein